MLGMTPRRTGQLAGSVTRWFGADRYATGMNYPDALGGSAAIGARGGVLLLTKPTELTASTSALLAAHADDIDHFEVFGEGAISSAVYDAIGQLLP